MGYCTAAYLTTGDARALRVLDRGPDNDGSGGGQQLCDYGWTIQGPPLLLTGGSGDGDDDGGDTRGPMASVDAERVEEEAAGKNKGPPEQQGELGMVVADDGAARELQRRNATGSAMAGAAAAALMAVERPWLHRDIVKLVRRASPCPYIYTCFGSFVSYIPHTRLLEHRRGRGCAGPSARWRL